MQKDILETTNDNPIVHLLEKHDAFSLLDEKTSCLYPQIWGLCEFERNGFRYKGEYDSPEKAINIKYEIYQTPKYEDVIVCETNAALKYWVDWQNRFPRDFVDAILQNSPQQEVYPYQNITLVQQITFAQTERKVSRTLTTEIYKNLKRIPICKRDLYPTTVG